MKATPKILAVTLAVTLAAGAVLVGGLALYGTGSNLGNLAASGPCAEAAPAAARLAPLARGEVAAFDASAAPKPAPDVTPADTARPFSPRVTDRHSLAM